MSQPLAELLAAHHARTLNFMADRLEQSSPITAAHLRAEAEKPARKIVTEHVYPPIPFRGCDWCAHFDDPEGLTGWGRTEAEAIADLKEREEEAA